MGSDEEVWEVFGDEISGDGLVVAGWAGVFEYSFVVSGINPNSTEDCRA